MTKHQYKIKSIEVKEDMQDGKITSYVTARLNKSPYLISFSSEPNRLTLDDILKVINERYWYAD